MADKPFVFSLASVLRLREHESEQARLALAHVVRKREQQQREVEAAEARLHQLMQAGPSGGQGPAGFRQFDAHCRAARRELEQARARLAELNAAEATARTNVVLRHQAEEALRTLYDQEAQKHREAVEANEARFLDDQAVAGYQRQRNLVNS
ncbi:MAG: flagellar export protein FliJ [Bacteroidetes bacterium]|nr:hypothetical protein AWN76_017570 [Rhodothermaceae bacterium RA]RMH49064.1 MAG: flagellar export protein FliJ [Bacteroidota bacterium]